MPKYQGLPQTKPKNFSLDYMASGMTEKEILKDFPDLTKEDIRAVLAFAADRERKLTTIPA